MNKYQTSRKVSLTDKEIAILDKRQDGRSGTVRKAVRQAASDPTRLVDALSLRLTRGYTPGEYADRITIAFSNKENEELESLNQKTGLSREEIIRLSLESLLHNETVHETQGIVQSSTN